MKVGGRRNFGYGAEMGWAGYNAVRERFGAGHHGTVAAHAAHWKHFCGFAREQGVRDARQVSRDLVASYARYLTERIGRGEMKVAYAHNLLSSVNVVLAELRGDRRLQLRPADWVGRRRSVRERLPRYLDHKELEGLRQILHARSEARVAAQVALARELMLRFKETCLLDAHAALREAEATGRVAITQGTKGGQGQCGGRWVTITEEALAALREAVQLQGDARNLIPPGQSYRQWREHCYHAASSAGMQGFHDLRAAGACERYQALTGHPAPVVNGGQRSAPRDLDRQAREALAPMLGHWRIESLRSYIGTRRG